MERKHSYVPSDALSAPSLKLLSVLFSRKVVANLAKFEHELSDRDPVLKHQEVPIESQVVLCTIENDQRQGSERFLPTTIVSPWPRSDNIIIIM